MAMPPAFDQISSTAEGMHAYVERHYGARAGKVAGAVVVFAVMAMCAVAIFVALRGAYQIANPLVSAGQWPALQLRSVGVAAVGIGAFGILAWLVVRKIRAVEKRLVKGLMYIATDIEPRLAALEDGLERFQQINSRVSALENHTDIHGTVDAFKKIIGIRQMITAGYKISIDFARYGLAKAPTQSVDVKSALETFVTQSGIDMLVSNENLKVSPFVGQRKKLFVTYSINGAYQTEVEAVESEPLVIP